MKAHKQRRALFTNSCCWITLLIGYLGAISYFLVHQKTGTPLDEAPRRRLIRVEDQEALPLDIGSFVSPSKSPKTAPPFIVPPSGKFTAQALQNLPPLAIEEPSLSGSPAVVLADANKKQVVQSKPKTFVRQEAPPEEHNPATSDPAAAAAAAVVPPQARITPTEDIVRKLLALSRLPSAELQHQLNSTHGADVFQLQALERKECPANIDWLPVRPQPEAADHFRRRAQIAANHPHGGRDTPRPALVWYEHLSKAGGTSFCKLAKKNMPRREIPEYYCMPSEPGMPDARVGQWSNVKLGSWYDKQKQALVSNEWEPFPLDRLQMQLKGRRESGAAAKVAASEAATETAWGAGPLLTEGAARVAGVDPLLLLLVTTVRDPLNRLLSAWRFWGVLHNPSPKKPPAARWLKNMEARAKADSKSPRGMGKGVGTGRDFIARVGQPNFATWKFSGGTLPVFGWPFSDQPEEAWVPSFEQAVRTLSRFDLAIPMELLSEHPQPLGGLLGWEDFSVTHVVSSGKVVNTDAHAELGAEDYHKLWDANRLDHILYAWIRAVYLARIYCAVP